MLVPGLCCDLPSVGCSQQPPIPSVPAGALPMAPALPGHHLLLGRATAKSEGFSSISYLLQHCLALGREWGCGYLPRARIWALFLSLKMSTPPGLRTLLHSIEVWGFLLTPCVLVADKIWPVIVEIPACAAFFFFQQNPYVAEESSINFSCLASLI